MFISFQRGTLGMDRHYGWTEEEEERLVKLYPTKVPAELAAIFDKSESAVVVKCYRMGLRRAVFKAWTREEEDTLIELYKVIPKITTQQIADQLGKSRGAIVSKAGVLGIAKPRQIKANRTRWSDEEIVMLKDLYYEKTMMNWSRYLTDLKMHSEDGPNKLAWTQNSNLNIGQPPTSNDLFSCIQPCPTQK